MNGIIGMHLIGHSASALPFIVSGNYWAALGCVAPDLTWIANEIRFRRSGYMNWHNWAHYNLTEEDCLWYRMAHSFLIVVPACLLFGWYEFLIGWLVHLALDLPTHYGQMQQRPLFPCKWKWKWVFRRYK